MIVIKLVNVNKQNEVVVMIQALIGPATKLLGKLQKTKTQRTRSPLS